MKKIFLKYILEFEAEPATIPQEADLTGNESCLPPPPPPSALMCTAGPASAEVLQVLPVKAAAVQHASAAHCSTVCCKSRIDACCFQRRNTSLGLWG
jgi:hypothetical protein